MPEDSHGRMQLERLATSIAQSLVLADDGDQPLIAAMLAHCLDICRAAIADAG